MATVVRRSPESASEKVGREVWAARANTIIPTETAVAARTGLYPVG
jgi:hypothetical protein